MRAAIVLVMAGCFVDPPPPQAPRPMTAPDPTRTPFHSHVACHGHECSLANLRSLRDRMCSCTTRPCVDQLRDDMRVWADEVRGIDGAEPATADQASEMRDLWAELAQCVKTASPTP